MICKNEGKKKLQSLYIFNLYVSYQLCFFPNLFFPILFNATMTMWNPSVCFNLFSLPYPHVKSVSIYYWLNFTMSPASLYISTISYWDYWDKLGSDLPDSAHSPLEFRPPSPQAKNLTPLHSSLECLPFYFSDKVQMLRMASLVLHTHLLPSPTHLWACSGAPTPTMAFHISIHLFQ